LIVALEATGYEGPVTARTSRLLEDWSVEKAKRIGASAAKLLVYYHPDATNAGDQERLVADVYSTCKSADLALFVEPISFSLDVDHPLRGEDRRRVVVETARRLTAIGGDILKSEFPYFGDESDRARWEDACFELDSASRIPWVLLSGGVAENTFEGQVEAACMAGASGVAVGRSVWSEAAALPPTRRDEFLATNGARRLRRIAELVHGLARPWHQRPNRWASLPLPGDGWFRDY
jgi:tagatose-1,6-bisphosphate aldolase